MKIVVAPDSYKECLSSHEVAAAMAEAALQVCPSAEVVQIPLAGAGFWAVRAVTPEDMPPAVAMDPEVAKQNIFSAVIRILS